MTVTSSESLRLFEPGTTGWTVDDLDDPRLDNLWEAGAYEIVEGVLTKMPPAYFDGAAALQRLVILVDSHLNRSGIIVQCASEVDLILGHQRLARPDAVFVTPE